LAKCPDHVNISHLLQIRLKEWLVRRANDHEHSASGMVRRQAANVRGDLQIPNFPESKVAPVNLIRKLAAEE
jgi:hypothetical protein